MNNKNKPCEWCPDNTCSFYWEVQVFDEIHIICNCCYHQLKRMSGNGLTTREFLEGKE